MCLIARAPMTGSQLVTLLRRYPLAGTGKSPGAVYPALYRLEEAGLVCARSRPTSHVRALYAARRGAGVRRGSGVEGVPGARDARGAREFGLTGEGVVRLRRWATRRVTRTEVLERPQHLLLRFAMCTGLAGPTAARRVALQCRRVCAELARELVDEIDRDRGTASPSARLAMECTLALLEARVAWARRAEIELARHAARAPELDLPPAARRVLAALDRLPNRIRHQIRWPLRDGPPPLPPPKPAPRPDPGLPSWDDLQKLRRTFARCLPDPRPP